MLRNLLLTSHLSHFQAASYAVLAYFLFALSDGFAKLLMADGWERSMILVITSIPSMITLTLFMIKRHGIKNALHTNYKTLHIIRCLALIGVTYFGFKALQHLQLADFYGIVFSTPLVVTLGAFLFFKERISLTEIIVILIGFSGTLIVAQPDFNDFNIGYLYGFGGVICVTIAALSVRKMGREEDPYLFVIFANLGITLANIGPALYYGLPLEMTLTHGFIFIVYCIAIPVAILVLSAVFSRAPTLAAVAPFQYSQIIWGTAFGYIVFHDIPSFTTILGSVIVISSGLYILFYHQRQRNKPTLAK